MECTSMKITFGYEMSKEECEMALSKNNLSMKDFNLEKDAFEAAAAILFSCGLGCDVEFL